MCVRRVRMSAEGPRCTCLGGAQGPRKKLSPAPDVSSHESPIRHTSHTIAPREAGNLRGQICILGLVLERSWRPGDGRDSR
jgi:hypothetical protein